MIHDMTSRSRKYKRWLFLSAYAFYALMYVNVFGKIFLEDAEIIKSLHHVSLFIFWGVCFVLILSMPGRTTFWSRPVKFLIYGLTIWLVWGILIVLGGLTLLDESPKGLVKLVIFTTALIMASKIVDAYDLKKELVGITAFILAASILWAYITHFNGLEFMTSIANVLNKGERYRISFGFVHVNAAGRVCLDYFMCTALYKALHNERYRHNNLLSVRGGGLRVVLCINVFC